MSENEFVKLANQVSNIKERLATIERRLKRIEINLAISHTSSKRPKKPATKPPKLNKKTKDKIRVI